MGKAGNILTWTFVSVLGIIGIYATVGIRQLMRVGYNIIKFSVVNIAADSVSLILTLKICNPSFMKVDIDGYNIDISLNNKTISNIKSVTHASLIANGNSIIEIPIKILFNTFGVVGSKEFLSAFSLRQYDRIFVTLHGELNATILKVPAHVPVNYTITLAEIQKIMDDPKPSNATPCK